MDISSMLEVQVNEVKEADSKENVTPKDLLPSTANIPSSISEEEFSYYKLLFGTDVSSVRFAKLHCTACDIHIGSAPGDANNMFEHPVLHTLLCAKCREFYGDGTFEQGDDATDMFCRWCANGGNLYCCSFCSNTFCSKCIKRNFDLVLRKKIEMDEKWKCFVCDPTDLYPARANCWALLEYVQRMNRLLQNTCKLSQQEIDEKINLDETKCCPRKSRRRKRRRLGSMSEDDEDATYRPHYVPVNPLKRKKRGRRPKYLILDGSTSNVSQSGVSEDSSIDQNELPPSLLSCEQTMVEVENTAINTDSVVTQSQTNSSPPKEPTVVQPNLYNTIVNVVASPNFLSPAPQVMPLRQVPGPLNQMNLYQAMHCGPAPMVTIPNQNAGVLNATHTKKFPSIELRPPPPPPPPLAASTPNVIEIESDSEEGVDVGPSRDSRSFKDHVDNNKAVPVALVSSKNNYSQKKQDTIERCNTKTLNQRLLSYSQEVDSILSCLKVKLQDVFDVWKQEELKKHELHEARNSIKQFHREMRDTVTLLACINDRVVREYNRWKRNQIKSGAVQGLDSDSTCSKVKNEDIPLDMVCVNESDSDVESDLENSVIIPSEFVGSTSIVEGIKNFRKRATVTRAVGNDEPISLVDKFVQIYDVELRDYDKCIRPTAMKVPDQQPERQSDSSTYSNEKKKQPNDYVKEFLNYLQNRVEPENIQKKESKDLPNPNETPLKDLIEANSPFISEMLETMDEPPGISNNINNSQISDNGGNNSNSPAVEEITNSVKSKSVDNFEQMVNNISNTIHSKKTKAQEKDFSTSDDIHVVKVLKNNEQDSSRTKRRSINSSKKRRDGCTIISN